jgi:hypothetical protein
VLEIKALRKTESKRCQEKAAKLANKSKKKQSL